jgi:hypothetical protein
MSTAADALARLVEDIDRERLGAYGAVVRIGDDEAAHRWRSDDRENLYSVSKGVCALAVSRPAPSADPARAASAPCP